MTQAISHDRPASAYFMQIPNMADDDLDPFQFRLYAHYIRRAGGSGVCFESVRTTAQACKMSITKVIQARDWLVDQGWISTDPGNGNGTLNVRIRDRMPENVARYAAQSDPNMERSDRSGAATDPNMDQFDPQSDPNMDQPTGASDPNMDQTDPNMDQSDPNMEPKNIPLRISNKDIPDPDHEDRRTDRDPGPVSVCLSVDDDHTQARREIIQTFQAGGVFLPATADPIIDSWIAAYPAPAIRWAIQDAMGKRKKIKSWSSYISAVLENRQAEGWPPSVLDDLRRGGYALEGVQADPTAGEFPQPDPVDLGHADHAPDLVQPDPDPGSDLDQAWAAALDDLRDRLSPVFVAALASCRLVSLNGRATVRAHDDMAAQAVTRTARQLEIVLNVAGVDLAA